MLNNRIEKSSLGLKDGVLNYISNKVYMLFLLLTAIGSYGFLLTHYSISIDDLSKDRYYGGELVAQGRLTDTLLSYVLPFLKNIDCLADLFGITALCFSAILFCVIFDKFLTTKNKVPQILFSCLFVSYPLHSELFIYNGTSVAIGFGCILIALSAFFNLRFIEQRRISDLIISFLLILPVASWYESVIIIYVALTFAILLLKQMKYGKYKFKEFVSDGLAFAFPLIFAVIAEMLLNVIVLDVFNIKSSSNAVNGIYWSNASFSYMLKNLIDDTVHSVFFQSFFYVPLTVFMIALVASIGILLYTAIKKKSVCMSLCIAGMILSLFLLSLIQGYYTAYRICQVYSFFVGFISLLIVYRLSKMNKKFIYSLVCIVASLTVVTQISSINYNFVTDNMRYEEEKTVVEEIGYTLEEHYNLNKPVIFVGTYKLSDNINNRVYINSGSKRAQILIKVFGNTKAGKLYLTPSDNGRINGEKKSYTASYITWGITAFREVNTELIKFFNYCGFDKIKQGNSLQYINAQEDAKNMPAWPAQGSIKDDGEYIIVNFG